MFAKKHIYKTDIKLLSDEIILIQSMIDRKIVTDDV